jgi:hypothetical protein
MAMVDVGGWLCVERSAGGVAVTAQRRGVSWSPRSSPMHACWDARRADEGTGGGRRGDGRRLWSERPAGVVARCSRRGGTGRGRCSYSVQRIDPTSTGRSSAATQDSTTPLRTEQGSDDCSRAVGRWAALQSGNVVERRPRMQVRGRFRRPALWLVIGHVWL